ncbi:MAG: hypothetical protein FVQ81_18690 [Candidatus Glassbacteria bacterium]|nr:hypothetical protein [Candidatus Glassbacteria bacterium]
MLLGLNWDTWISLASVLIVGLMAISAERSRRGARLARNDANLARDDAREEAKEARRVALYPPRRKVWDDLVNIQDITLTNAASASAGFLAMRSILEAAIHIYPKEVLDFLESMRIQYLLLESAFDILEGGGAPIEKRDARERKGVACDEITDLLGKARGVFAEHIDFSG